MTEKIFYDNDYIQETLSQYSNMVYRLAFSITKNKSDAEDVFQEVFIRFIKHSKNFESEEHRKSWLLKVTINCSKKVLSSAWFKRTVPLVEDLIETEEMLEDSNVYHAVMNLPLKYRTVIHLFYYEDLKISEISNVLFTNESTIKSRLCRARKQLKSMIGGDFDEE